MFANMPQCIKEITFVNLQSILPVDPDSYSTFCFMWTTVSCCLKISSNLASLLCSLFELAILPIITARSMYGPDRQPNHQLKVYSLTRLLLIARQ